MTTNNSPTRQQLASFLEKRTAQAGGDGSASGQDYHTSGRAEKQAQLPEGMEEMFQIKLTLAESEPAIWRTLLVPASIRLDDLHVVIQIVMGWDNSHLHQFIVGSRQQGGITYFSDPTELNDSDCQDEAKARLDALLVKPRKKIRYLYDFGDSWMHHLVLEKILVVPAAEAEIPRCVSGERACPPDDVGGIWGWEHILAVRQEPNHPDYEHLSEMFEPDFDPEAFDIEPINAALKQRFTPKPKQRPTTKTR